MWGGWAAGFKGRGAQTLVLRRALYLSHALTKECAGKFLFWKRLDNPVKLKVPASKIMARGGSGLSVVIHSCGRLMA